MNWNPYSKFVQSAKQQEKMIEEFGENSILWDKVDLHIHLKNYPKTWDDADYKSVTEISVRGHTDISIHQMRGIYEARSWVDEIIIPDDIELTGMIWKDDVDVDSSDEYVYESFKPVNLAVDFGDDTKSGSWQKGEINPNYVAVEYDYPTKTFTLREIIWQGVY